MIPPRARRVLPLPERDRAMAEGFLQDADRDMDHLQTKLAADPRVTALLATLEAGHAPPPVWLCCPKGHRMVLVELRRHLLGPGRRAGFLTMAVVETPGGEAGRATPWSDSGTTDISSDRTRLQCSACSYSGTKRATALLTSYISAVFRGSRQVTFKD